MSFKWAPLNRNLSFVPVLLCALLSLAGCGIGAIAPVSAPSAGLLAVQGKVMGGQQPVSGASIQLYTVGLAGNASLATSILTQPVFTGSSGGFTISNDYPCADPNELVYITATGGNPGLPGNATNPALALMIALGTCANLQTTPYIVINEVTTVAAAWALAPFMKSTTLVGATSTNLAGLRNAFATANVLANQNTGYSPSASLPGNASLEVSKIYSLANVIASCVNSDGTAACAALFAAATPVGGTPPTDSIQAALSIVTNPSHNVTNLFYLAGPTPPFAGGLASAPKEWTMSLSYRGGGLSTPTQLAFDSSGNAWVANYNDVLSAFTQQGSPIFANGISDPTLQSSYGLTIDSGNNIWVADEDNNSNRGEISRFDDFGNDTTNYAGITAGGVFYPQSLASAPNGDIWVADFGNSTITLLDTNGNAVGTSPYGGVNLALPAGIASDANNNAWVANGESDFLSSFALDGTARFQVNVGAFTNAISVDTAGNVWATSYYGSSVVEVSSLGIPLSPPGVSTSGGGYTPGGYTGGGITFPQGIAIDGANNVWIANYHGASFSELSGAPLTSGTPISPSTGYGRDASLALPFGIAVDNSGSVWVVSLGYDFITSFVGLATPVKIPLIGAVRVP